MSSTEALSRAGEAAAIAITKLDRGDDDALSGALLLVYRELMDAAMASAPVGWIDQSGCAAPPCPAVLQAIHVTAKALQDFTGQLGVELLAGLMVAVRRLAELEDRSPAEVVAGLVASAEGC